MTTSKRDYYEVLGVNRNASPEDLKRAYRTLAMKYHPDRNRGDDQAAVQFKEAAEAFEVLNNPDKRERYDRYGHAGLEGMAMPDFAQGFDIFSEVLGGLGDFFGSRPGESESNIVLRLELSLEEAYRGCKKTVKFRRDELCNDCDGSGCKRGVKPVRCRQCNGRGVVVTTQFILSVQPPLSRLWRSWPHYSRTLPRLPDAWFQRSGVHAGSGIAAWVEHGPAPVQGPGPRPRRFRGGAARRRVVRY